MSRLEIRDARASDYGEYVRLFAELGIDDFPVTHAKFTAEMVPSCTFAERDGRIVGFTFWRLLADTMHLAHIVSAPEARRTGAGRALLDDVIVRARGQGLAAISLNVAEANVAARSLYESVGFSVVSQSRALRLLWSALGARPNLPAARVLEPGDDGRLEPHFKLPAGIFAAHRGQADRVLRYLETPSGAAAAMFDASFPGANPFRATDVDHALALIHDLRAYARPEHGFVNLALEHQLSLCDALLAAGATLRFDMLKMRCAL
jgi:GNAT superfamily N-acetyltransferase